MTHTLFNEMIILERQLRLHAIQDKISEAYLRTKREELFGWIIDLERIQTCLNYYRDYEKEANCRIEDALTDNAKLRYEVSELKRQNAEMQKIIDGWGQLL